MTKLLKTQPTKPHKRGSGLTPEGLIPLHHLWYLSSRVRDDVCAQLGLEAPQVYMEMLNLPGRGGREGEAAGRRWQEIASGRQAYVALPTVDRIYVAAGLHIYSLGEPDVHSSMPPVAAYKRGMLPAEKLASEVLASIEASVLAVA